MKITLTGSLGHIGKPLAERLVQAGHEVTVITSKADRKNDIEALGARALVGSIDDLSFLTNAFTGADLVYTMVPPSPGAFTDPNYDIMAHCTQLADNFAGAIETAGVRRVIHLSSIGGHTSEGNGLLKLHNILETRLGRLEHVDITFMRPTGFYYNLFAFIPMIKRQGFIAANYGGEDIALLVAPADIAEAIAEEVAAAPVHRKIRYVASEELSCNMVAAVLGNAIGKPDLQWHTITSEQMLQGSIAAGMPPAIAKGYVEMYAGVHDGTLQKDYFEHRPASLGRTKLTEFAKAFAAVYNQSSQ